MSNVVLIDTGVAGQILSKVGDSASKWNTAVEQIISEIPQAKYVIPTPVWHEIAQWNGESFREVEDQIKKGCSGIYQYAGHTIPNYLLMDAAWYKCETRMDKAKNPDKKGIGKLKADKISMIDALIACYSLRFGYFVLTLNQQDFPDMFFELIKISQAPSSTEFQRDFISLLRPNQHQWQLSRNPRSFEPPF